MANTNNALLFLVDTVLSLYILVVLLRVILQLVHADFMNPVSQFVWQITPTKLAAGGGDAGHPRTQFGGAFLAPYWVWRSAGKF